MAAATPPPGDKDTCVVQFMDESEGGGKRTPHPSGELCRPRLWEPDSHACKEGLDQVRKAATKDKLKLKLVVKKSNPPATPAAPPAKDTSPKKRDWDKRTRRE